MPPKRLLDTRTYRLVDWNTQTQSAGYAILSHRWREEITFEHFRGRLEASVDSLQLDGKYDVSKKKHFEACVLARNAGIDYLWADTVCIDKSNSEELSMSLRSMYNWYREARICYAFLDDVKANGDAKSVFRRVAFAGQDKVEVLPGEQISKAASSVWFGQSTSILSPFS